MVGFMFTKLTKKLDSFIKMGIPFYDCIVMKDGKCVYRHASGYTDIKNKVKVTGKELYNIYSCTKLITCVAALQLWERGVYSLEDKLSDYMPEFKEMTVRKGEAIEPAQKPILIKHLFTMTAGFSYDLFSPQLIKCREETNGVCQTRETMKYLAKEPLLFEPGECWKYSLCHDVLAALVEVLSGMTFGEYVKKNIFEPLGMYRSTFLLDDSRLEEIVNQYEYCADKGIVECDKTNGYKLGSEFESGGAGCISTVEDYIKFLEALRIGNVILKEETIDMLATNQLTKEQIQRSQQNIQSYWEKDYGYGLGQRCPQDDKKCDFGWGGAAGAYYAIDRKNNITFYLGVHVLDYAEFQNTRVEILPIIQEIIK